MTEHPSSEQSTTANDSGVAIVAIGASAGGVSALKTFFENVSPEWPFCYVVIQHLSSEHKSQMKEILQKCTTLPIVQVNEESTLQKGYIYLIPPGKLLNLSDREKLEVSLRPDKPDINKAINFFFVTLGKVLKERAVGVILSGTGSDGLEGVKAIKDNGGFVIVQHPEQAEFDGMPLSAISAIEPDDILPVEKIPDRILDHYESDTVHSARFNSIGEKAIFDQILKYISELEGVDFSKYKEGTLYRRIKRRMNIAETPTFEAYFSYLKETPAESDDLFDEFFIGVTEFFRDPGSWDGLRRLALSDMIKTKVKEKDLLKIWCVGCCTGEEVYSLAILIREELQHLDADLDVKIFATDIRKDYISKASQGIYLNEELQQVPSKYLNQYFTQKKDAYKVRRQIRDMIIFSKHNVIRDTPFHKLDLVTCRNMLIYLKGDTQRQVIRTFEFSLRRNGVLFIGNSENIGKYADSLESVDKKARLFRKVRETVGGRTELFSNFGTYKDSKSFQPFISEKNVVESKMFKWTSEVIAEELGVVGMYIDENFNILHAFGNFSNYASLPSQGFTTNLLKLLQEELMLAVQISVRKAARNDEQISYKNIKYEIEGEVKLIDLIVKPVAEHRTKFDKSYFLIFKPVEVPTGMVNVFKHEDLSAENSQSVIALEEELKYTREHLQATIQELEFSNEELQATNEELISANEELQSTNEELQSLNEELHTVNAEHREKIEELAAINADMDNLMESTKIGTIFLDRKLCIRKFTPAITAQFNIRYGDLGRPISHFTNNLGDRSSQLLQADIHEVIIKGKTKQSEILTNDNEWYIQRITPFINSKSVTDGVVISFINITELKNAELELRHSDEKFRSIVEGTKAYITIIDLKGLVLYSNNVLETYSLDTFIGSLLYDWMDPELATRTRQIVAEVITTGLTSIYENKHLDPEGNAYYFYNVASPIFAKERVHSIAIISNDVTEIKELQNELMRQNEELARRNQELEQFAFISSHDLQEPLKTVTNFTQLVAKKYQNQLDEMGKKSLSFMQQATERMSTLIRGLREYSQLQQARHNTAVDCKQILDEVVSNLGSTIDKKEAIIEIGPMPELQGHAPDLYLLFSSLLSNALKFQQAHIPPHIVVHAVEEKDHWQFSVQDNGIGIHSEYHEQIFGIFQRLHKQENYEGTGIGLAYCKKIVELHGGRIWLKSQPNQGSTFYFTVPH
ncbi:CheR family methyltransferase [Flavilitoribacter nigricans]|uniref:Protein-glutamate O-methyltransferase n=1 Tax=Flavilitoribacter nigricans (strain ATCC 23147 / DSM 23189 / NBRC 102662 / NCIMB 1420 / SS-2) TaxID=1122177 RepID=A0A2D0NC95_FLAN2|nr:CheR family methyltransferase [Flavilitoribacter nigricans]PHN06122.1 hypothetical protein CRP01_14235 [Flavilitoribacter nigricans DSM 23189 = NBRC 102662]